MYQDVSLRAYLSGRAPFEVGSGTLDAILAGRGVDGEALSQSVAKRDRELCLADVYVWCAGCVSSGTVSDSHGDWKHSESRSVGSSDRSRLLTMADRIYRTWGEPSSARGVKLDSFGIRWTR